MLKVYEFDFSSDDGNWNLANAIILGGVLDITASGGSGHRHPDANWLSGTNDDFEIEIDFKQDAINVTSLNIDIFLIDDTNAIRFFIRGSADMMSIFWNGAYRAEQAFVDDLNWHTHKIRRVGTTFYWSIDGGAEISWDYGTERAIQYLYFGISGTTGEYDNFKYSFMNIPQGAGVGNPMIL